MNRPRRTVRRPGATCRGRRGVLVPKSLRPQRIGSLILAAGLLTACTPGPVADSGPSPAGWTNPVAFCGYLDRPAVAQAIAAYLAIEPTAGAGALRCGDAHGGGPLSRGGRFSYEGRSEPSVVVWLDI